MSVETNKLMNLGDGKVLYDDLRGRIDDNNTLTKTIMTPAAIQSFTDGAAWPMEMEIAVEPVQSGTGDPSPSNLRPITGWTGANIGTAGKNIAVKVIHGWIGTGANLTIDNTAESFVFYAVQGVTYKAYSSKTLNRSRIGKFNSPNPAHGEIASQYVNIGNNNTDPWTATWTGWTVWYVYDGADSAVANSAQIEIGETASAYESFKGDVYHITFPSSAGTVYGGTLTVHADGTGTLVVDRASIELDGSSDENWLRYATGNAYYVSKNDLKVRSGYIGHILCDKLKTVDGRSNLASNSFCVTSHINPSSGNYLYAKTDENITTAEDFKTWLSSNNIKVVYELDTPVTYTLSVPQVLSILGQNNIWADCGNINELSYVRRQDIGFIRDDTAGQIRAVTNPIREELNDVESSLAIVIDGDTAPKNIASGQYVFVKNHSTLARGLYHATAAIASGASITSSNVSPDADGGLNSLFSTVKLEAVQGVNNLRYNAYRVNDLVVINIMMAELPGITQDTWTEIASVKDISIDGCNTTCIFRNQSGNAVAYGFFAYDKTLNRFRVKSTASISTFAQMIGTTMIAKII